MGRLKEQKYKPLNKDLRVNLIIDFEQGNLDLHNLLILFKDLVKTNMVYSLQGSYGRCFETLKEKGLMSSEGEIL